MCHQTMLHPILVAPEVNLRPQLRCLALLQDFLTAPGARTGLLWFFYLVQRWEEISCLGRENEQINKQTKTPKPTPPKPNTKKTPKRTAGWWLIYTDFIVVCKLHLCLHKCILSKKLKIAPSFSSVHQSLWGNLCSGTEILQGSVLL